MSDLPPEVTPPLWHDRLHGRRRGRRLRALQQARLSTDLPAFRVDLDTVRQRGPRDLFPNEPRAIWLEIGFGGGEHLAWQAAANPGIGLLGCEVFQNGIVSLLHHLEAMQTIPGLDESGSDEQHSIGSLSSQSNRGFSRAGRLSRPDNVRVFVDDAKLLIDALPAASIDRCFILFPDPWPKARHHKRRLVSPSTMAALARLLADGGELRLATDDAAYLRVMLAVACGHPAFDWMARRPADWQTRPVDWPATRYEQKAIAQGRRPAFLSLLRRPRAGSPPAD